MKKLIFATALILLSLYGSAQIIMGVKLGPNVNDAHIKDNDGTPSAINFASDGYTENAGNQAGFSTGASFDFPLQDNWYFGTGAWFTSKNLYVRNTDAFYSGVSKYNIAFMQIPALLKYRTGEVFIKKLNLVFGGGPVLDMKIREALNGGDGAHYWNLAKNLSYMDPARGHNGNNKSMALFSPINLGLYISAGAEYQLLDKLAVTAGFSFNGNFLNMINPALKFDDASKTPVHKDIKIRSTVVSFDLGVLLKGK
jgi:hypothetical protein